MLSDKDQQSADLKNPKKLSIARRITFPVAAVVVIGIGIVSHLASQDIIFEILLGSCFVYFLGSKLIIYSNSSQFNKLMIGEPVVLRKQDCPPQPEVTPHPIIANPPASDKSSDPPLSM
jgi:hypothetical protein